MKTDNEAIKELEEMAKEQKRKSNNFWQWLIIAVLSVLLLIVSFFSQPKTTKDFIDNKNIKETILAIPISTVNPYATKVKTK